jgi:photosystem II stability/assembly factor-like uncharacterized protein
LSHQTQNWPEELIPLLNVHKQVYACFPLFKIKQHVYTYNKYSMFHAPLKLGCIHKFREKDQRDKQMKNKWLVIVKFSLISLVIVLSMFYATSWFSTGKAATGLKLVDSEEAPNVTAIMPESAANDLDTPVLITGTGFAYEISGDSVITQPSVSLDGTPLVDVDWISSTQLAATVPWGLEPGTYTATVTNPDGQSGSLESAITITQGIGVWTTGGPYGGAVTTLLINPVTPTTLYATVPALGSGIGLFRSVNGGAYWELIVTDIGGQFHEADVSAPELEDIYLHKWGDGLHRSDDGGDTWTTLPFPTPDCFALRPFAHPVDSQTVYVAVDCTFSGGIYKSEDQGANWITLTDGLTDTRVTALAFDPEDPKVMYAGTASGHVFRSIDRGENWDEIGQPDQFISSLAVNPFNNEPWATGADDMGHFGYLWKYVGDDWEQVEPGDGAENNATSITFSQVTPDLMWIATQGGGLKSIDGGDTWESLGAPPGGANALLVDPTDAQVIYLGYNGLGIAKTIDGGLNWAEINQGLAGVYPTGLAIQPNDPATVYATAHGTGTFKTNNAGDSWLLMPSDNLVPRAPLVDPSNPNRLYVGKNSEVCATEDDGVTWTCSTPDLPLSYADCCGLELMTLLGLQQPGRLIMGVGFVDHTTTQFGFVGGGIYISTDYGESWQYVDVGEQIAPVTVLAADPSNSATIYAGTDNRTEDSGTGVWKSEDGGETWSLSGLSDKRVTGIAVDPFDSQLVYAASLQQFYVSTDAGVTWSLRATQAIQDYGIDKLLVVPTTPVAFYLYGWNGMLRSLDGGLHWGRADEPFGYANIGSMAATTIEDRLVLYVGTAGGTVIEMDQGSQYLASTTDTLVNAGVYKNIIRTTDLILQQYLPLLGK